MHARARLIPLVGTILLANAALAHGPSRGWDVSQLAPVVDGDGAIGVSGARTLGENFFSTGVLFSYVDSPLVLLANPDDPNQEDLALVESQILLDYVVAVAFGRHLQVGAGVPVALSQQGDDPGEVGFQLSETALGDARLEAKWAIVPNDPDGPGFALAPQFVLPSGDEGAFFGESGVAFHPRALADFRIGRLGVFLNVGAKVRTEEGQLEELHGFSNELTWGAAASIPVPGLADRGFLLAEYRAATQLSDPFGVAGANPAELDGAIRYGIPSVDLAFTLGAGAGVTQSAGSPALRGFLGIAWRPTDHDQDGDGIEDSDDGCPPMPEDVDGFEDSDGCPDLDNDADGVDDGSDRCPAEAEDRDGTADDDGCPDPDADSDGVADADDRCANEAEDRDSFQDDDGCPDADNDSDGVADGADRCANEAEDRDSFQDDDGCPDPDNDSDGKPDGEDRCPTDAEDRDSFEDEDGCPDIDNDRDGVVDASDTCADRAETINGTTDEDGCPDAGPAFRPARGEIRLGAAAFAADGTPTAATRRTLDQLAHLLIRTHATSGAVALRIATAGSDPAAAEARGRAVQQFLRDHGVPAASTGTASHSPAANPSTPTTVTLTIPQAPAPPP
jgi:hypothetical protein